MDRCFADAKSLGNLKHRMFSSAIHPNDAGYVVTGEPRVVGPCSWQVTRRSRAAITLYVDDRSRHPSEIVSAIIEWVGVGKVERRVTQRSRFNPGGKDELRQHERPENLASFDTDERAVVADEWL